MAQDEAQQMPASSKEESPWMGASRELSASELAEGLERAISDVLYEVRGAIGDRTLERCTPPEARLWAAAERLSRLANHPTLMVARIRRVVDGS